MDDSHEVRLAQLPIDPHAAAFPPIVQSTSWSRLAFQRFVDQHVALAATIILVILCLMAVLAPFIAPYDPVQQFRKDGLDAAGLPVGPNAHYWLGTDGQGRDMLSRLIWGARISLGIGIAASSFSVLIGLLMGSVAGMAGGALDAVLMRFVDIVMSLPGFFVILLLVALFRPSLWITIMVITLLGWTYPARLFRTEVVALRERDFILAARCLGIPEPQIVMRHILPHLVPLAIVAIGLGVPGAIFAEAGLSFLGLGVPPPAPAWGGMIQFGTSYYRSSPLQVLLPGAIIVTTVVCFNLVGAGLRDALDPTMRRR